MGKVRFPAGIYAYTGSAKNGLRGRLSYHLKKRNKKGHWHIDYLLKCPEAQIQKILIYLGSTQQECRLSQGIAALPHAKVILQGFGASDCLSGCASHLVYFARQ
ncbi:MAG: DUF123 domain-containing protein [Deltaproteobacteria bacterium]|nr:DUF123 domain-containing protein [Deltaproteobacteria bacterium]